MTTSEIAAEHAVSRQSIHAYRRSGTFPRPVEGEGSTRPRFRADEVAEWFAANPPRPGKRTDLSTRDEGVPVEATKAAVPPAVALKVAREFVQWLRAQIDEDERAAQATAGAISRVPAPGSMDWRAAEEGADEQGARWRIAAVPPEDTVPSLEVLGGVHSEVLARHCAEYDPRRVLREIDSKRRIVDLYAAAVDDRAALRARMHEVLHADSDEFMRLHRQESKSIEQAEALSPVVRLLALPYADRPGYREEWRP
jgi:predicted DNA-binding transcriptional regulator AlpA